jgi:hypothetical protein
MNASIIITSQEKPSSYRWVLTLFFVSIIVLAGCAQNYGRLQRSEKIDKIFKTYQVLSDHKYYYAGPGGRPDAIIGIHKNFTFETTQWTQFDPAGDTLKRGVDSINFHNSTRVRNYPYGFIIFDPEDRQVGVWYSIWDWTTVIMGQDNLITVFPPAVEDPFGNGELPEKMEID